ncbi:MAG: A24 family peptidase, partial [Acetobacteraceae bacterium]
SVALLLAAAATDIAFRRVPNAISLMLAVAGIGLRAEAGSLLGGLFAAAIVFAMAAFCWRRGWLGGGDVKLLAAATLTLPPLLTPSFLLAVALAGGALAILYLALSVMLTRRGARTHVSPFPGMPPEGLRRPDGILRFVSRLVSVERWRIRQRTSLPYAAAIAAGALFVLIKQ